MNRAIGIAVAAVIAVIGLASVPAAQAGERAKAAPGGAHPSSKYYRKSPEVRGYVARRGGYSYSYSDTINTYGDSRTLYGATQLFRDPMLDRQTNAGPFDHGFFFESGVAPRGGNSPYMN